MNDVGQQDEDNGGNASLEGWFYQRDVSVWIALDLLVVKRVAKRLQLEPASQEDIETDLDSPRSSASTQLGGIRLVIQAKLRSSTQWTAATLKSLVEHGTRRRSAIEQLGDSSTKYLLVTSTSTNGDLAPLTIKHLLEIPRANPLPGNIFPPALQTAGVGRFAVLALHDSSRVQEKIEALLLVSLSVPTTRLGACIAQLRCEAFELMRSGGFWHREDLERVIKEHEGHVPSDPTSAFVKPRNWESLLGSLRSKHAVLLTGPSGTGKTTVARRLAEEIKLATPGMQFVEAAAPGELRQKAGSQPTVFYIEDPWGKYKVGNGTIAWSDELRNILPNANKHWVYVVTSRSDILSEAADGDTSFLGRWKQALTGSDYGPEKLGEIYAKKIAELSTGTLRTAALQARGRVVAVLSTPFELERFFEHLKEGTVEQDKNEHAFVERVLQHARHESIEQEIVRLISARDAYPFAAVLWALLRVNRSLSREALPLVLQELADVNPTFVEGLEELVNAMVAGGYLKQPGSDISYAHPRVESGLVQAIEKKPVRCRMALEHLLIALVRLQGTSLGRAGVEAAAYALQAVSAASIEWRRAPGEAQTAIDTWLDTTLATARDDYAQLFKLAQTAGSESCVAAEIARWFRIHPRSEKRFSLVEWTRPNRSNEWYQRVHDSGLAHAICGMFLRYVLSAESRSYPLDFADDVKRLSTGLDSYWVAAAQALAKSSYEPNAMAISYGAMQVDTAREELLDLALKFTSSQNQPFEPSEEYWARIDGHFDNDEWEESHPDDGNGLGADAVAYSYVWEIRRREGGWRKLSSHPRLKDFREYWLDQFQLGDPNVASDDELLALFDSVRGEYLERRFWSVLGPRRPGLDALLRGRLTEAHTYIEVRLRAVSYAYENAPDVLHAAAQELVAGGDAQRLAHLSFEVFSVAMRSRRMWLHSTYRRFRSGLPELHQELAKAFTACIKPKSKPLSDAAKALAHSLLPGSDGSLRAQLVWLTETQGKHNGDLSDEILSTVNHDEALMKLKAAIFKGARETVENALKHPRAIVRRLAMDWLIDKNYGVVPQALYELATDKGNRVRISLARHFEKRAPDTIQPLIVLCADTWTDESTRRDDDRQYPVARVAAQALAKIEIFQVKEVATLLKIAENSPDQVLQLTLFEVLANTGQAVALQGLADNVLQSTASTVKRVNSACALVTAKVANSPHLVFGINASSFMSLPPEVSVAAAMAVGRHGTEPQILSIANELAEDPDRRILLVGLAIGGHYGDDRGEFARSIIDLLPPGHPVRGIFGDEEQRQRLPHDALDDLGSIQYVNPTLAYLSNEIEARPALIQRNETNKSNGK